MAKKQATNSTKSAPVAKSAAAKSITKAVAETAASESAAVKSPALSIDEIGHAAGAIWLALSAGEPLTLTALKKATGVSSDLTMAGVGWLAREDKLQFDTGGRSPKIGLR